MRARAIVIRGVAVLLGLSAGLIVAELTLRVSGYTSPLICVPDPELGWFHTPGDVFDWKVEGRTRRIRINSHGLRDTEHPYEKPPEVRRVLLLGDSFAEALQVDLEESVGKRLEHLLNERNRDGTHPYEVINGGVNGFGTDNELLFFRREGRKYESDLVLLAFYLGNDLRNNWYPLENKVIGESRKPHFEPSGDGIELRESPFVPHSSLRTRLRVFLNMHSRLRPFLMERWLRLQRDTESVGTEIPVDWQLVGLTFPGFWRPNSVPVRVGQRTESGFHLLQLWL